MYTKAKALHSAKVANVMYQKAIKDTGDDEFASAMFHLGLVHDIGYQLTCDANEHSEVGAEFLRKENYPYWREVKEHHNPDTDYASDALYLLMWANMRVSNTGCLVSVDEHLNDIGHYFGFDSETYLTANKIADIVR